MRGRGSRGGLNTELLDGTDSRNGHRFYSAIEKGSVAACAAVDFEVDDAGLESGEAHYVPGQ
jgi:hypothetical protein